MSVIGYVCGEPPDVQRAALVAAGADFVFDGTLNGNKSDRRQLASAIRSLSPGDTLLVTRLKCLARSTRDLLNILDSVSKAGAGFRSLSDQWADTTTADGRLIPHIIGGLAEFEKELIRTRTGEGRRRAKARGQHMGRPPALTPHQREEVAKGLGLGAATQADLARRFQVSQSTISRLADKISATSTRPQLDAETLGAAGAFMQRISRRYAVSESFLFGSRARLTHGANSDADIAIVLNGPPGKRSAAAIDMAGIAFEVMLETGILIDPLPLWRDEMEHPELFGNPALLENIRREGVLL
jgi:DNA invertase Pin-like site-specific DNA recombinase/predicted nucleotidyltransferase